MGNRTTNKLGGIGQAFSDRNFRIYSVGSVASWISYFVQIIAVSWLTWELTRSTTWLAVMALMDIVPNIILLPFAGALADRFDRYKIMQTTNFLLLIQASVLAFVSWMGFLTIETLVILVLIHGILISFMVPAMWGILPRFVSKDALSSAIAVSSSYTNFAVFAGPAFAGYIISKHGITLAFVVNALGYAILIASFFYLKTPEGFKQPDKSEHSFIGDIQEGFKYILNHEGIKALLILMLAGDILMMSIFHMMPAFAENILGMGVEGLSIMLASFGIGATLSAIWLAHGGERLVTTDRILWAFLVAVIASTLLFASTNLYFAVASGILLGLSSEIRKTGTFSLLQLKVNEEQRGRVMGNKYMLTQIAGGIGTYAVGTFAMTHGLVTPIMILCVGCFVVWIYYFAMRGKLKNQLS